MALDTNAEAGSDWLRYTYSSLAAPTTTYELNVASGERRLLKREPVLGGFDAANYTVERLWAPAHDGARIPVSLVYRKGFVRDGKAALLQYGYGSYGSERKSVVSGKSVSVRVDSGGRRTIKTKTRH